MVPYTHERKQFGQPIGDFELMQGNRAARCWRAIGATFWSILVPRAVAACGLWPLRRRCAFGERRHRRGPHLVIVANDATVKGVFPDERQKEA